MMSSVGSPKQFSDVDLLTDTLMARIGHDVVLALPLGLGKANHVVNAIFARAAADRSISLNIFTALTLETPHARTDLERRFLGPVSARAFGGYPALAYAAALRSGGLPANVEVNEFFFLAASRLGIASAQQSYISANYTHALRYVLGRGVNVVAQLVAKRVVNGEPRYSLSCNPDMTLDLLAARREKRANFLFVGQVNTELPFMPGDGDLPAAEFDFMLESPQTDFPLFAPPREPVDLVEYAAGLHVARLVPDGGTLQLGIGSLGDAVAQALVLRHHHNVDFRDVLARLNPTDAAPAGMREDSPFDIGLYGVSEMFVEAFLDLMRAGVLRREVDGVLLHSAFFVGSRAFYRALRELPADQLAKLHMTAVSYVNEIFGDEATKRRARIKARFINNAMMATLLGAVVSDGLENGQVVSGVGGQYNFVAQGFALDDARSIIMLRATREAKGRATSNIRWNYGHTTIPRHLRDVIVTEYGVADLRGRTDREVIVAMLGIADSRFQDELMREAKAAGKLEKSFEIPAAHRDNTPDRIARALAPARAGGLIPPFPFGTDFTATEQLLIPALQVLQSASSSPMKLAGLALRGFVSGAPTTQQHDCLARMGLARPRTLTERVYSALLRAALSDSR